MLKMVDINTFSVACLSSAPYIFARTTIFAMQGIADSRIITAAAGSSREKEKRRYISKYIPRDKIGININLLKLNRYA